MFVVSLVSFSQNIIANGDFESGTAINLVGNPAAFTNNVPNWTPGCTNSGGGSPDIFDVSSTYCQYGVPANKNANNRQVHISGTRRYAGFGNSESILGTLKESLSSCEYKFEAYYAPRHGFNYCNGNYTLYTQVITTQLEVVLRNSSNPCGSGLVVYTGPITLNPSSNAWNLFSGNFTLTSAQTGYDRIEIRQLNEQGGWVYIDDISLKKVACSTADIEPTNELGYVNMESRYGLVGVARFCEDEIVVDGSGSELETAYILEVTQFDLLGWSAVGPNYSTGWVTGTAPSNMDLQSIFPGLTFQIGVVYQVKLSVGPNWDSDFMYFAIEECCPTDLELVFDCENEVLTVLNLPSGIQGSTTWRYAKKLNGIGSIIQSSSTIVPSIPATQGYGWYYVQMYFTMPNGVECSYSGSFYWSKDYCCTVLGPQFEAVIAPSSIIGYQTVQTIPWGTQNLPIVSCNGFRVDLQTDCFATEPNTFYVGLSTFDPINWVGITSVYSNGNFNPATFPSLSSTEFATLQSNTWYILAVCVGSDCSYMVFRTNDCSAKNRVQEEVLNDELKVSLKPNPTKSVTNVELSESTTGVLIVSSISGEEIRRIEFFNSNSIDVDVTNLQVGVYILQVRSNDEVITTRLLKE